MARRAADADPRLYVFCIHSNMAIPAAGFREPGKFANLTCGAISTAGAVQNERDAKTKRRTLEFNDAGGDRDNREKRRNKKEK